MPEELSHTQVQSQVNALLNPDDQHTAWIREVWSDKVVYEDGNTGRLYQQALTITDNVVAFDAEPVEVRVTYTPL